MTVLSFICRVKQGNERKTLTEAAKRVAHAWVPFSLESTRPRGKSRSTVIVRPLMGYMFVRSTTAERDHLMSLHGVIGPVWYVFPHAQPKIDAYKREVEATFRANRIAWATDAATFHCRYKPLQAVSLRVRGMELFKGTFRAVRDDGLYEIDGPWGRVVAEPSNVAEA